MLVVAPSVDISLRVDTDRVSQTTRYVHYTTALAKLEHMLRCIGVVDSLSEAQLAAVTGSPAHDAADLALATTTTTTTTTVSRFIQAA